MSFQQRSSPLKKIQQRTWCWQTLFLFLEKVWHSPLVSKYGERAFVIFKVTTKWRVSSEAVLQLGCPPLINNSCKRKDGFKLQWNFWECDAQWGGMHGENLSTMGCEQCHKGEATWKLEWSKKWWGGGVPWTLSRILWKLGERRVFFSSKDGD